MARPAEDIAPGKASTLPPSPIETVIPNRSYVLKLDCISCPFLIRHSNRNEWEKEPRPNQLTLILYIDDPNPRIYLQGESLNPLWYERRAPSFYSLPYPFAPPFIANQIGINATLQQEENNSGHGVSVRQFELAYEFEVVTYAPKDRVQEWEVLIEFEITGLRHEEHVPKDIPFFSDGVDAETKGLVPGMTSIVRVILGYTAFEEMRIKALEFKPKEMMAEVAGKEIEALRKAAELTVEKSITTADWGGKLRDIDGPDGKDMYIEHASFKPGKWNDCGRKDEWGRQIMCTVDDIKAWSPVVFVMSLILVAVGLVGMFTLILFASWLGMRILRGQKVGEVVAAKGEDDALLLFEDEALEEENEKMRREHLPAQNPNAIVCISEQRDNGQFGPYQHNAGGDI